jgi:hypothetical protein
MKYSLPTIAKALMAFGVTAASTAAALAGGPDLSGLEFGQWLSILGAGLTAGGGVFVTPNKDHTNPAERIVKDVQQVITEKAQSDANLAAVRDAIATGVGALPGMFGPLGQAVINSIPLPFVDQHPTNPDIWRGQRFM